MVGPQRVRDLCPAKPTNLLKRRYAIIQVWRPIRHPVETFPLAICDARTLSPNNLVISERRYPGRIGQTYAITYDAAQKWFWFPRMRREEALVFKVLIRTKTAAPAGPRIPRSTIRPRRRTLARAKASKSARWRFSEAN